MHIVRPICSYSGKGWGVSMSVHVTETKYCWLNVDEWLGDQQRNPYTAKIHTELLHKLTKTPEKPQQREVNVKNQVSEDLQSELYKVSLQGLKMETKYKPWTVAVLNNETWVSIAKKSFSDITEILQFPSMKFSFKF